MRYRVGFGWFFVLLGLSSLTSAQDLATQLQAVIET